jgi:hypothetical protein
VKIEPEIVYEEGNDDSKLFGGSDEVEERDVKGTVWEYFRPSL